MQIVLRAIALLAVSFLVLLASGAAWLYWRTRACLPELDGDVRVPGLAKPVEVLRDARGVPHLRAHSLEDLLFAQGYVTAQDRLWQMDLHRRLAQGELSEIFGEATLRLDIENRRLGLGQVMERAIRELGPDSRNLLAAYARGVNAFIDTHRNRLPIEFFILHYRPRPWRDVDSFSAAINMIKSLSTSWPDELMRERIRRKLAPDLYAELFPDHSPLDEPVAEAVRPEDRRQNAEGRKQKAENSMGTGELGVASREWEVEGLTSLFAGGEDIAATGGLGSNNWVLSGAHTRSGKPLLASDPHLGHSVPGVWYMIHLKAPGIDVSGVSLPGLPLVVIGHNERIAWGMTNTAPDVQDLYAERFNPLDPRKYLHNGDWIEDEEREEMIRVRNKPDYRLTVRLTRHGPIVLSEGVSGEGALRKGERDLALRWTALQPHALRFPFLKIDRARNWQEFTAGLRDFTAPMQNFVYADVDGNIGFYAAGWVPVRKQGDGTVPSPGETDRHDWTGFIPFEKLPHAYNPESGMIATANGRIVPDSYPYFITRKWEAPYRTARIFELLCRGNAFTVSDLLGLQTDIYSMEDEWLRGQLLAASLGPAEGSDARYALDRVRNWDGEARWDSVATLVLEATRRALLERLLKPKLGDDFSAYRWPMSTTFLANVLRDRRAAWLPPGDADFNATLARSLEEALRRIPQLVGSQDRSAWKWGETIPLTFRHPLSSHLPVVGRLLDTGPYPQSGMGTTVKQTTPSVGPSMRMVVDFSNFDKSVQNVTLGESGQVSSPYYRDQFRAWYAGRSFPMPFSDAAVEAGAVHKLVLQPTGSR